MTNVELFRQLLADWQRARDVAGGELSQEAESAWTEHADSIWRDMTREEQDEVDPR